MEAKEPLFLQNMNIFNQYQYLLVVSFDMSNIYET